MPYNTRRKSLSLSSLGIHVPATHASRVAAAAAAANTTSATPCQPRPPAPRDHRLSAPEVDTSSEAYDAAGCPQSKRVKRWHDGPHQNAAAAQKCFSLTTSPGAGTAPLKYEDTPPPSPDATSGGDICLDDENLGRTSTKRVPLHGINDGIVEAVITQLEATGNRPHTVKELAAVLSQLLPIVQHSANPSAIISSRLTTFLKRSCWTSRNTCPLAKELEAIHPRRTYFFLTTGPRQPLPLPPASCHSPPLRSRISPSLSVDTASSDLELADAELRRKPSPSPEVDLSSPGFDYNTDLRGATATGPRPIVGLLRERRSRGASPPLEKDEKEFTQTATGLQKRKMVSDMASAETVGPTISVDETLFCDNRSLPHNGPATAMVVSPAMKPSLFSTHPSKRDRDADGENWHKLGGLLDWDHMPENMELEELDCLLESC